MKLQQFSLLWALAAGAAVVSAHDHGMHTHVQRCRDPSPDEARSAKHLEALIKSRAKRSHNRRALLSTCEQQCDQCIEIDIYFHLLAFSGPNSVGGTFYPHPTAAFLAYDSGSGVPPGGFTSEKKMKEMLDTQLTYLNDAYKETPFRFVKGEAITTVVPTGWGKFAFDHMDEIAARAPHSGEGKDLNVYLVAGAGSRDDDFTTAGFSSLPHTQSGREKGDGIFMRYDTLPGGGLTDFDVGETLVHEAGHWLGLQHVFSLTHGDYTHFTDDPEDPCDPDHAGDFIDDTPQMKMPTDEYLRQNNLSCMDIINGQAAPPDTCPNVPGVDPVFNYMNYLDRDECMELEGHFTLNQIERMCLHWVLYRDHVSGCDSATEMEIELVMEFDATVAELEGGIFVRENPFFLREVGGDVIFDSTRDSCNDFIYNKVLLVDICVPRDGTYEFVVGDRYNDGLGVGFFEIWVEGKLFRHMSGNIETPLTVPISESLLQNIPDPTPAPTKSAASATIPSPFWLAVLLCFSVW